MSPTLVALSLARLPAVADIFARTTGTDGDLVVEVIGVFQRENAIGSKMGGYQLAVSLDIVLGRYRKSFEHPSPIPAGQVRNTNSGYRRSITSSSPVIA